MRKTSRSNSRTVSASGMPCISAMRRAVSTLSSASTSFAAPAGSAAFPAVLRSTERIRSTSSRGENGLVT
jgi:hypothetical protein